MSRVVKLVCVELSLEHHTAETYAGVATIMTGDRVTATLTDGVTTVTTRYTKSSAPLLAETREIEIHE